MLISATLLTSLLTLPASHALAQSAGDPVALPARAFAEGVHEGWCAFQLQVVPLAGGEAKEVFMSGARFGECFRDAVAAGLAPASEVDRKPAGTVLRILALTGQEGFAGFPAETLLLVHVVDTTDGEIARIPDSAGGYAKLEQQKLSFMAFDTVPYVWAAGSGS